MKKDFNEFRFNDLNYKECSNKYFTMDRVNKDETKIVVKVADCHLFKTKFGYALILDRTHVVFLKDWQVSKNWFGNEVLLIKEYFNIKEWGEHEDFMICPEEITWEHYLEIAKNQANYIDEDANKNIVKWEK